jgi:hypothetical protein
MKAQGVLLMALGLAACGSGGETKARALGTVDLSSFEAPRPVAFEARADDDEVQLAALDKSGAFSLALSPDQTWSFRVVIENDAGVSLAIPRRGHFDRAVVSAGRVDANFGTIWLPPPSSDVARVAPKDAATCEAGRLQDGTPCAVLEALVSCAEGPPAPVTDSTTLLLGTGALSDLPGSSRGRRYVVPSRSPPPILWECTPPY